MFNLTDVESDGVHEGLIERRHLVWSAKILHSVLSSVCDLSVFLRKFVPSVFPVVDRS
jgi:hypothetical protein